MEGVTMDAENRDPNTQAFEQLIRSALAHGESAEAAAESVWQHVTPYLNRVVVHRVICDNCGPVVVCIRLGATTYARTRDVKLGPGKNAATSVEGARRDKTLDGERWWPAMVTDLTEMARWPGAVVNARCRCLDKKIPCAELLARCDEADPGRPKKPTRL